MNHQMDIGEFVKNGQRVLEDTAAYYESLVDRPPMSTVEPGYLYKQMPLEAPEEPESFEAVRADIETKIMPGITHWQSGNFFAWYPGNTLFPSMLGDMYCNMLDARGFNWIYSPAVTELETVVTDWLGKLLGLSPRFMALNDDGTEGVGGGIIQGTASEAVLLAVIAARQCVFDRLYAQGATESDIDNTRSKMVVYYSDQTHSCSEKATLVIGCKGRKIATDSKQRLMGPALRAQIDEDKRAGLIPFFVCGTFGSTNTAAIDDLEGIADIAAEEQMWFHVDAAYAGAALVCPEFRSLAKGMERADSVVVNPHKWLLTSIDCSVLWVADSTHLTDALNVEREYLPRVRNTRKVVAKDYHRWEIPLGHKFRAFKLWFVLRMYGAAGLRKYIRGHMDEMHWLQDQLVADGRFEIVAPVVFGLVVFRLRPDILPDSDQTAVNKELVRRINADGRVFLLGSSVKGMGVVRASIGSTIATHENTRTLVAVITEVTTAMLAESS